ncbi:MAG: hypothetical protein BroJett018_17910 [Chloroflexota bacterium]|nr:hypothetical protein [Chloroflexota bacterium]NOG63887.1 hypothetical protein [Chloroflexota bacterium]GIK63997.1 MAG: hypothetical protein BroJett018_17910 [Chloroflexota bacterium]
MTKRLASLTGVLILVAALLYATIPTIAPAPPTTYAQNAACDPLVQEALQKVANTCLNLGRNEICYGYQNISAILRDPSLTFESEGDIVGVDQVETLITRPIDPNTGEWGIAMMRLQANLPNDSDGYVTVLVFGGTEINNQVQLASNNAACQATNNTSESLNIRSGPGTNFPGVDIFDSGATLPVDGRNEAGDWLHIPNGWISASLVTTTCDTSQLALVSNSGPMNAPMQSFTLRMDEEAACQAIPTGMMVQTESGQTATVMVNNVQLQIGSTAQIRTNGPNGNLVIRNIQGNVVVTSGGKTVEVEDGEETNVPFEDGEPTEPEDPYESKDESLDEDLFYFDGLMDTSEWDFFDLLDCTEEFDDECIDAALYTCENEWDESCGDYYGEISDFCTGDDSDFCLDWEATYRGDSDFDGLPDDMDTCPDEFGFGEDGCPTGEEFGSDEIPDNEGGTGIEDTDSNDNGTDDTDVDDTGADDTSDDATGDETGDDGDGFDSDGDGLTDDADTCPSEFGTSTDGCPE